jgi:hypothetical protein
MGDRLLESRAAQRLVARLAPPLDREIIEAGLSEMMRDRLRLARETLGLVAQDFCGAAVERIVNPANLDRPSARKRGESTIDIVIAVAAFSITRGASAASGAAKNKIPRSEPCGLSLPVSPRPFPISSVHPIALRVLLDSLGSGVLGVALIKRRGIAPPDRLHEHIDVAAPEF